MFVLLKSEAALRREKSTQAGPPGYAPATEPNRRANVTRIDFYILPGDGADGQSVGAVTAPDAVITACKLCDKASAAGSRVFVYAPDSGRAEALDAALWSFRQGSFIGHERLGTAALEEPLPAVLIGAAEPPLSYQHILINLGLEVPPFFSRFERVLEIVDTDTAAKAKSRERYKFYRDRGYELATHNL